MCTLSGSFPPLRRLLFFLYLFLWPAWIIKTRGFFVCFFLRFSLSSVSVRYTRTLDPFSRSWKIHISTASRRRLGDKRLSFFYDTIRYDDRATSNAAAVLDSPRENTYTDVQLRAQMYRARNGQLKFAYHPAIIFHFLRPYSFTGKPPALKSC